MIDNNYLACGVSCASQQINLSASKLMTTDNISLTSKFTEDESFSDFVGLTSDEHSNLAIHSLMRVTEVQYY